MERNDSYRLRDLAELAVTACLPVLPLHGSWDSGYTVSTDRVHITVLATPEEWADAAHAIAELHAAVAALPGERPSKDND